MTSSTLRPQLQTAPMRQLGKKPSRKKNIIQQGFTLVELMVVIVIVGILSAVALPQFLSQSEKAKATEAKSNSSAIFKNAAASYQEGTVTDGTSACLSKPTDNTTKFNYTCTFAAGNPTAVDADGNPAPTGTAMLVVATGNNATNGGDPNISGKKLNSCYSFATGKTVMDSSLSASGTTAISACQ